MWSWTNIKEHRDLCRRYKKAYKEKLATKKPSAQLTKTLEVRKSCDLVLIITLKFSKNVLFTLQANIFLT